MLSHLSVRVYIYEVRSSMCILNPCQASEEAFEFLHVSESTQAGAWIKGLSREIKCQITWLYLNEEKKKKHSTEQRWKAASPTMLHVERLFIFKKQS